MSKNIFKELYANMYVLVNWISPKDTVVLQHTMRL